MVDELEKSTFNVVFDVVERVTYQVEAYSEDEAVDMVINMADKDFDSVEYVGVSEL